MANTNIVVPIQRPNFRPEDLDPKGGLQYFNQFIDQLVNAANLANGAVGPSVLPSGVDVAGGKVTGLAAPTSPTDAISSGHAQANYSAPVLSKQLDIGGPNALKGLTGLQMTSNSQAASISAIQATLEPGISATVALAKLTGGGANGSMTFVAGILTAYTPPT